MQQDDGRRKSTTKRGHVPWDSDMGGPPKIGVVKPPKLSHV